LAGARELVATLVNAGVAAIFASISLTGFSVQAWATHALQSGFALADRAHQRTFWLGTMNVVELGASEPPLKNLYAATITMMSASTAIRSICLGS
jgi:hypothetical protein